MSGEMSSNNPLFGRMDTSQESFRVLNQSGRASALRGKVWLCIKDTGPKTVHEVAAILDEPVPAVQPRFSELKRDGFLSDTKLRRINKASGKKAAVWACTAKQFSEEEEL